MAQGDVLTQFVHDALGRGVPRAEIERTLLESGWSKRQVNDALAAFADVQFPVPVPRPRAYTDAREAFLYGLLFLALYVGAFNLGALLFAFIDRWYPITGAAQALREAIRGPLSVLVVAGPLYAFVMTMVNRDVRADPSRRTSEIRNKLTYLTLFLSAATVIGVLAGLVYSFLGPATPPMGVVLKLIAAAAIAGLVFWYYLRDVRVADKTP